MQKIILIFCIGITALSCTINESNNKEEDKDINNFDNSLALNEFKFFLDNARKNIKSSNQNLKIDDSELPPNEGVAEEVAEEFVNDLYIPSLDLIHSYGITDQEIIDEFGSLDPHLISMTSLAIIEAEDLVEKGYRVPDFSDEDYISLKVDGSKDTIGGCIADALSITAAFEVLEHGVMGIGKKGVLKLVKKVAGKYLGLIGIGFAVYDFADCMGWI